MSTILRRELEVGDIVRAHGAAYLSSFGNATTADQRRILRSLAACRTAVLGGHRFRCDHCGHQEIAYNSCRNRHCPKCQATARARWMEAQASDLLPVPYFHVVFTIPPSMAALALRNRRVVYGILFRSVSQTLLEIAADPKHLGARIGFLAVLHTWGQNLMHHPHLHCLIPGGGLSADRSRWVSCHDGFFLPVRVLSKVFRGKFLALLRAADGRGELSVQGLLAEHVREARRTDWVVYAKPPFGRPEHVIKYLARYTHSVAISNSRLIAMEGGKVTFRWKDYTNGSQQKTMTLEAVEFIRRFLLHALPPGFMRIRHFGFLGNRSRQRQLARCRELLGVTTRSTLPTLTIAGAGSAVQDTGRSDCSGEGGVCPACKEGLLIIVEWLPRWRQATPAITACPQIASAASWDTS